MAAELLAEATELAHPGLHVIELHDVAVLQGVVLDAGPVAVRVTVETPEPLPGGGSRCVTTLSRPGRPGCSYRTTAVLAPIVPVLPSEELPPVAAPAAPSEPYAGLLFHGPLWQGIESVVAEGAGWLAAVHGLPPERLTLAAPGRGWLLYPTLLDLGPQLAILWSRAAHGTTPLPVRFGTVRCGRTVGSTSELGLRFRVRPGADAACQVADFEVRNPDGTVRLAVAGLEGAATVALNRLTGSGAAR
jgi:hypothetical protein